MPESMLSAIENSVQHYAQAISTVLEMDVDIVDVSMMRIAGTGGFSEGVGKRMEHEGSAFRHVLETRTALVVENPGKDPVCLNCKNRLNCKEQFELCCPIILDGEVLGVMSLAVFNRENKQNVIAKLDHLKLFLEQMANLIAAKAAEHRRYREQAFSVQLLKKLMDFINEGVILFGNGQQIMDINEKCRQIFGMNLEQMAYLKKIKEFAIYKQSRIRSRNEVEYVARIRTKKIRLVGRTYPIVVEGEENASVFVFRNVTDLSRDLLQNQNMGYFTFDHIIGLNDDFAKVREQARKLAYADVNLLITGETGTGKEIFARAIHNESARRDQPFVTVSCSGAVETVMEKELFGYSFLPGEDEKLGRIHMAHGGTLYLDEIGDLSLRLQSRLAEILQSTKTYGVRLIAGSSRDLMHAAENGEFRKDLYYSLKSFEITLPPVRQRPGDIPLLIEYFLNKYCRMEGKHVTLADETVRLLKSCRWEGNIREIEKTVSYLVSTGRDGAVLQTEDLPASILNRMIATEKGLFTLDAMERDKIRQALNLFGSHAEGKKIAARELGIGIATLYRKMRKYGIEEKTNFDYYQNDN